MMHDIYRNMEGYIYIYLYDNKKITNNSVSHHITFERA